MTKTLGRLIAANWADEFDHVNSRAYLMREHLRRTARWVEALGIELEPFEWPFFDLAAYVAPGVRADPAVIEQLTGPQWPPVRRVVEAALHWEVVRDLPGLPKLPDPYEPLLVFFEQGGDFRIGVGGVIEFLGGARIRTWQDWLGMPTDLPAEKTAIAIQTELADRVQRHPPAGFAPRIAAGLDVAYAPDSNQLAAAAVCVDIETAEIVASSVVLGETDFPYVPGLFAFRELPALLEALARLDTTPDVLVCDGQGLAHPRRFGLACHAGVLTGLPSIGVGKQALGRYEPPGDTRGEWTPLIDDDEVIGRALRSQDHVKPVFVSIGHRIDLETATDLVLKLSRYRLPETTRAADHLCRGALAGRVSVQDVRD